MKTLVFGILVGLAIGVSPPVFAAVGDLIYEVNETITITGAQAATIADCYIAEGSWSGARSNMRTCTVARLNGSFSTSCSGTKEASAATLPINGGVQVVGRVE